MFRSFLELCRISNLPTVWTNVIAAWVIASGGQEPDSRLTWLLLGASLIYSAGMILNDACDVAWDRNHRPERPIPSGRISLRAAWAVGIAGLMGGYALMVFYGGAQKGITAALVGAILLYDIYHKPWSGSVVVMGACRTLLYLAVGSSLLFTWEDPNSRQLIAGGLVMGFYIIGLSLVARHEASPQKPGKIWFWTGLAALVSPLLGGLLDVALLTLHPNWFSGRVVALEWRRNVDSMLYDPVRWQFTVLLIALVAYAIRLMRTPPPSNIGKAVGWLLAGIPLVDATAIIIQGSGGGDLSWGPWVFLALVPLLRYWQRWVAAT